MHHEGPECRKMFHAGNCTLFVKVNSLSSGTKIKRAIIHFSLVCCSWTCCFWRLCLSTALSVPGQLINVFSGGEFIPGLA